MRSIGAWPNFVRSWRFQTTAQVATLSVLIGSFTILALAALVHQNLEKILTQWGHEIKVNVYLREEATDADAGEVKQALENSGLFSKMTFLSKSEAAKKFRDRAGQYLPGLLTDIEFDNPLPESFELELRGGVKSTSEFTKLVEFVTKLKKLAGTEEVSYGQGWVENYASVLRVFSLSSLVFVFVMLTGSLFVIGNSIRNSISQRRDEIEIMELFGATPGMITWPYIFEGLILGFVAAVLALFATYVLYLWQMDIVTRELSFWSFQSKIDFLSWQRIMLSMILGTGLGGLGSWLWVRKVTTGWTAADSSAQWSQYS